MLQNKNTVDKYFQDNWTETPTQYDGTDFETPTDNKWVSVQLLPYDRELIGISPGGGRKLDYGIIRVRIYDVSPTLSYNLAYQIQAFLECRQLVNDDLTVLIVDMGISDGNGAVPLHNNIYETTIDFIVKKYN